MAFIPYVSRDEADEELKELLDRYTLPDGSIDHVLWIHSQNPRSMELHERYYEHIMRGPSPVTRVQREMIALSVSAANDCFY